MNLLPYMEQWHMLPSPGGIVLCAVSGGRDSMCLLHYLYELGKEKNFSVAAAHLNHLMRPTAQRDVAFVQEFCVRRNIPFYVEETPVYERAKEWNITVEEAGRRARYAFLQRTAETIGAERIATAHHQKDQAETVLLNLLRGTGPEGLGGIPPVRGIYIRPLLDTPRKEIEAYLAENDIGHIEDETNGDTRYARNHLRLALWPELAKINPALTEHIASAAAITRRENTYLNELAAERLPLEGTEILCQTLLEAPEVLQSRMIRLLLERLPTGKKDVSAAHIAGILHLAQKDGILSLPGMRAICRDGKLTVETVRESAAEAVIKLGENYWGDYRIQMDHKPGTEEAICLFWTGETPVITVRTWQGTDRLTLPGSRGSRSVKRLFADRGIPAEERDSLPVFCVNGEIAAVWRLGTDQKFTEKQENSIYITLNKEP